MANAAAQLLDLFESWRDDPGSSNLQRRGLDLGHFTPGLEAHVDAMLLLRGIAREIDELEQAGRRIRVYRSHYPLWVEAVLSMRTNNWNANTPAAHDFPQPSIDALEQLADVLDHKAPPLHPDAVARMNGLLSEVLSATSSDESLDERLRAHIRKAVRHLQTCVDEYQVYGESATMEALDAVWAALGAAAHSSKNPGKWETFQERFFFPTVVNFLANAPSLAIQIAQASG